MLVRLDHPAGLGCRDRPPGLPGHAQDDERDRKPDDRITDLRAERNDDRARDHAERDEAIDASVVAVRDHGRARQALARAESHLGRDLIAEEADYAGGSQHPQMRELLRMDEPLDRRVQRHAGRDEDRQHDGQAGELLAAEAAQEERDAERHGREGVTEVVNQVGDQRDRAREEEDRRLRAGGEPENRQAERDGLDALPGAHDRPIDEPVRVGGLAVIVMFTRLDRL